jgi:hypothetical protein
MKEYKMRKTSVFVFVLASIFCSNVVGQESGANFGKGLAAYYPFNGNANDKSGNGHHGIAKSVKLIKDRFDRVDSAYEFNGNASIQFPDFDIAQNKNWSLVFWVLDKGGENRNNATFISTRSRSNIFPGLYVRENEDGLEIGIFDKNNKVIKTNLDTNKKGKFWKDDSWHMLAITSSEDFTKLYFDDILIHTIGHSFNPDDGLYLGMMPDNPLDVPFKGKMDDVLIYNRSLNQEEIKFIYNTKELIPLYNGPKWYVSRTDNNDLRNGSESYPFSSIQNAINEARDGHEVLVSEGTYNENINFLGKKILVKGISGANTTNILGKEGAVVLFNHYETRDSILDGFTISGGNVDGVTDGGIFATECKPIIKNCIIENNKKHGIYLNYAPILAINCIIRNNISGGSSSGAWIHRCENFAFIKCVFVENEGNDNGYLINQGYSKGTFLNCTIANNLKIGNSDWYDHTVLMHSSISYILNSIITCKWEEHPLRTMDGTKAYVQNSYIKGGYESLYSGEVYTEGLIFSESPGEKYHLHPTSKLIGAGTFDTSFFPSFNRELLEILITDGKIPNPPDSNPDLGAYEHPYASPKAFLITKHPKDKSVKIDDRVFFKIDVVSSEPIEYQWYLNGESISGATLSEYVIESVSISDFGNYSVLIKNSLAEELSKVGTLKLFDEENDNVTLVDTDFDGLTDDFETTIGTDPTNKDTDSDGFDDGYEITLNSNPLNADDTPKGRLNISNAVEIEFHTDEANYYQLQYSIDLENWFDYGDLIKGIDGLYGIFVNVRNFDSIFWRLRIE